MKYDSWPYMRWVAHRGAGLSAPENTLAAFKCGYEAGFRMFECDVKISADGTPYLLHDSTLDRTTSGHGPAHLRTWSALKDLDAGRWHSSTFKDERLLQLKDLSRFCIEHDCLLNIEIKPSPGLEELTGQFVARAAHEFWLKSAIPPLLTSFKPECLLAAKKAAVNLPRGLLIEKQTKGWLRTAHDLGCVAVVCHQTLYDAAFVSEIKENGLRCGAYTVNEPARAYELLALGVDMIITDRMDMTKFS